jgi:hypothetical protein
MELMRLWGACSAVDCTSHMVCCPVEVCFWQRALPRLEASQIHVL